MAAWTQEGLRLDIAVAVALEVAVLNLKRADGPAARTAAMQFNQRLWRAIGAVAPTAPVAEDRSALADACAQVAGTRMNADDLIALNVGFARTLAGRAATGGALRHILDDWRAARPAAQTEFGPWLVTRLERLAPQVVRLAA